MNSESLAKPSGITLRRHTQHVFEEARRLLDARPFLAKKYAQLTGDDLQRSTLRAAWWHDIGKQDSIGWQKACRADYQEYLEWRRKEGLHPERMDAKEYSRYVTDCRKKGRVSGRHILSVALSTGFRHEFESLLRMAELQEKEGFSLAEKVAVAAHHGHVSRRDRDIERWERKCGGRFADLWRMLERENGLVHKDQNGLLRSDGDEWAIKVRARYRIAGPRSLLQLADTRASRTEAGGWLPSIDSTLPFPYEFPPQWTRRGVQKEIERLWNDSIGLLRAPTGSGKTDAALLWIKHQVECGRADRGVIAMPTRFTSNALELNIRTTVSDTGLYHSSAWYSRFGKPSGDERDRAKEVHKLARLLVPPVTVCTVDHLLIALTGGKEVHHAVFFNLANAAVVFDEVDFYDPFIQANLTVLLAVCKELQVPVLLMSATLPESSSQLYAAGREIVEAPEETRKTTRSLAWAGYSDIHVGENKEVVLSPDVERVLEQLIERGTGIVYANTVLRAWRYWQWFRQHGIDDEDLVLYHSRFTEPHKKAIESRLLKRLGREAWEAGRARGFAILTQIGEMSVNISAPLMLSDACPWDRLTQRAGRNGRFDNEGDATLFVALPMRGSGLYPAPYGSYKSGQGWVASDGFARTVERLQNLLEGKNSLPVSAAFYVDEVNRLYPEAAEFSSAATNNRECLREWMNYAWMIVPKRETDEDEGTVEGQWRSRDIDPQTTVFTQIPEVMLEERGDEETPLFRFRSWDEYQGFALESGISIPNYLLAKEQRKGENSRLFMRSFAVGEDREAKLMWLTEHYSATFGLAWLDETHGETDGDPARIY